MSPNRNPSRSKRNPSWVWRNVLKLKPSTLEAWRGWRVGMWWPSPPRSPNRAWGKRRRRRNTGEKDWQSGGLCWRFYFLTQFLLLFFSDLRKRWRKTESLQSSGLENEWNSTNKFSYLLFHCLEIFKLSDSPLSEMKCNTCQCPLPASGSVCPCGKVHCTDWMTWLL